MIVLDGATGTELARRGVIAAFDGEMMLDSGVQEIVLGIHRDYFAAGAQVVTANTFRTNPRKAGPRWRELTGIAVALARKSGAVVAGSIAPVEDCYLPEFRPPPGVALAEHRLMVNELARAGCDLLLVETVNAADEGRAAVEAAVATGLPVWVSAMAMPTGKLKSGDDLAAFFRSARKLGAAAALLNCIPCDGVDLGLAAAAESGLPFGAYAHMGEVDADAGWPSSPLLSPDAYAARAKGWIAEGATIVGGCCGTTPAHIEALARISPLRHDPCHPDRRRVQ